MLRLSTDYATFFLQVIETLLKLELKLAFIVLTRQVSLFSCFVCDCDSFSVIVIVKLVFIHNPNVKLELTLVFL